MNTTCSRRMGVYASSLLGVLLMSSDVLACQMSQSSPWYWSIETLAAKTASIVIAEPVSDEQFGPPGNGELYVRTTFRVVRTLKGEPREQVTVSALPLAASLSRASNRTTIRGECNLSVSFERGKKYIVFVDASHPRAYDLMTPKWRAEVLSLIRK